MLKHAVEQEEEEEKLNYRHWNGKAFLKYSGIIVVFVQAAAFSSGPLLSFLKIFVLQINFSITSAQR